MSAEVLVEVLAEVEAPEVEAVPVELSVLVVALTSVPGSGMLSGISRP